MTNDQLLEKLDTALDTVDEVIQNLQVPAVVKRALAAHVYRLYSDAEDAVLEEEAA